LVKDGSAPVSKETPVKGRAVFVLIWIFIIVFSLVFSVHSNLENAGTVIGARDLQAIPSEIQPYMQFQGSPVIIFLKQPSAVGVGGQILAVISDQRYPTGAWVEVVNPILNWQVDYRQFPFSTYFDRLLISDNLREISPLEAAVELILSSPLGFVVSFLASFAFTAGPLLFVLQSYLSDKRPTFTSMSMAILGYSLMVLELSVFASIHNNYLSQGLKLFGFLSPAFLILVLLVWRFERSPSGQVFRSKLWGL